MESKGKVPSLVELCVLKAIDNVRLLGDVGETDSCFLEQILPHCSVNELIHVEKSTKGRDLSPITDKLWKKFYERQFGSESVDLVLKRMKEKNVSFKWAKLYQAKLKDLEDSANKSLDRIKELYKKEDALKQSRQVRLCSDVPASRNRRSHRGNGPGRHVCKYKSDLMKKSKMDLLKSLEARNTIAMKRNASQRSWRLTRPSGFSAKGSVLVSKQGKPSGRRF
ncbi:hypothetical protein SAY87_017585 [Trapa incisa]|uniref:Elongin-A n=1 Tax=Trapa incisa TaxID=236973 RepID=A0AAN7L6S7_9MYRT|nr:hypothetical protein SAY87_017585 [Trapa incisa]